MLITKNMQYLESSTKRTQYMSNKDNFKDLNKRGMYTKLGKGPLNSINTSIVLIYK